MVLLEEKDYVKFLGVPIDKNLTWRPHIDCIALKISKIVGTLAGLFKTSFTFQYSSSNLPLPEISLHAFRYTCLGAGSSAWFEDLTLQKRVLHVIFFSNKRSHVIPLFVALNILPVDMLYTETVATIMHDVFTNSTQEYSSAFFKLIWCPYTKYTFLFGKEILHSGI